MANIFKKSQIISHKGKKYKVVVDETARGLEYLKIIDQKTGKSELVHRKGDKILTDYKGFYSYENLPDNYKEIIKDLDKIKIE